MKITLFPAQLHIYAMPMLFCESAGKCGCLDEKLSLTSTEMGIIWHSSIMMLTIDALHMPSVNTGPSLPLFK